MRYSLSEYANPWVYGRNVFQPPTAHTSSAFQRLSDWRARLGALSVFWLSVPYVGVRGVVGDLITNAEYSLGAGAFYAIAAVGVYWLVAHPLAPYKASYVRGALKRAGLSLGVTIALGIAVSFNIVSVPVIGWLFGIWVIIFVLAMMWYCLRWVFGVGDAHPLLGPIVTVMTAFTALAVGQLLKAGDDKRPPDLQTLLDLGAVTSVTLLAVIESIYVVHKLRTRPLSSPPWTPYGSFGATGPRPTYPPQAGPPLHGDQQPPTRYPPYGSPRSPAGYPPPPRPGYPAFHPVPGHANARMNKLAVAAVASVLFAWPAGLVLGILALREIARTGERGKALAIAAIATAAVMLPAICVLTAYR